MNVNQQYALDVYRAAQRGETPGPAPGLHDWEAVREVRDYRRFQAVLSGRPARGRIRAALARRLFAHRGHAAGC
ncbi:hypothetical protein G3I40_06870 [Streptomyces sp. SID14478]|uniref:hypothetical protein n=1 Tax=Streptomyces sp. SID14478 TaxID=2706073 RepID=UPI0013DD1321|nr:hypothetical protein [Streptomyces sp. SID14478]NEB74956.1 hypothetical protein [Streptomyces sp. SID14478]